jgi:hypothetical protein
MFLQLTIGELDECFCGHDLPRPENCPLLVHYMYGIHHLTESRYSNRWNVPAENSSNACSINSTTNCHAQQLHVWEHFFALQKCLTFVVAPSCKLVYTRDCHYDIVLITGPSLLRPSTSLAYCTRFQQTCWAHFLGYKKPLQQVQQHRY